MQPILLFIETKKYVGSGFVSESESKLSVQFVLNVLRQHENDLDRSIAEFELVIKKIEELTYKIQQILDKFTEQSFQKK
jgi:hypothetical protein